MIDIFIYVLLAINVIVSILLVLLVLMQRPKSEGLGAAFGGGFTESIFGAQTSDVLTKMTIGLGSVFMVVTLVLAVLYSHRNTAESNLQKQLAAMPSAPAAEVASPSPSATASPSPAAETK